MTPDDLADMLGPNEVLTADSVVTPDEQAALARWIFAQRDAGKLIANPRDPGAYSTPFRSASGEITRLTRGGQGAGDTGQKLIWVPETGDVVDPLPDEFWRIRTRVIDRLGISGLEEDPYKGSFMSCIEPGTGVHSHRDDRLKLEAGERLILRCNVLFKGPEGGGMPVFEKNERIEVPDRGMWAFFATELMHAATPVLGSEPRGLLSYGFLVSSDDLLHRRFHLSPGAVPELAPGAEEDTRCAFFDALARSARTAGVGEDRIALLGFAMRASGDFTLRDAAGALERLPRETWEILRDLQRTGVVESNSSARVDRGRVAVF